MSKSLPNGSTNFAISGIESKVQDAMSEFGISRESATLFVNKASEHMLKATEDEDVADSWSGAVQNAILRDEFWAVEYNEAQYRKLLPAWARIVDTAVDNGHDLTTAVSIKTNAPMREARNTIGLVNLWKSGIDIESIARIAVLGARRLDPEETKTQPKE